MRPRLARALDWSATGAAFLFVAFFIGADLIDAAGWDLRGWLKELRERYSPTTDTSEIRNYVEFIEVRHDGLDITTGIRFASSLARRVDRQWCYADRSDQKPGDVSYRINLAVKVGIGSVERQLFTDNNLGPFGLTAAQANALIDNHCRFRD